MPGVGVEAIDEGGKGMGPVGEGLGGATLDPDVDAER